MIFQWITRMILLVIIVILGYFGVNYFLLSRSTPEYEKTKTVRAPYNTSIIRDVYAIPHIQAEDFDAALFALGYVHAQDRLWQMEISRRHVQGRLAEIYGEQALSADKIMRALDLHGAAYESYQSFSDEDKKHLEAYSLGINQYILETKDGGQGQIAPEFRMNNVEMAPWHPIDSIALYKRLGLMSDDLGVMALRNLAISQSVPAKDAEIFIGEAAQYVEKFPAISYETHEESHWVKQFSPLSQTRLPMSSEGIAFSSKRASSQAALLSGQFFAPFDLPSHMHLAHLQFENHEILGGAIPGIPAILFGRNNDIAWAPNIQNSTSRLVFLPIDPNTQEYQTTQGAKRFTQNIARISINRGTHIENFTRFVSEYGPVIPLFALKDIGFSLPQNYSLALNFEGDSINDRSLPSFLKIMNAEDIASAKNAFSSHSYPQMELMTASKTGEIMNLAQGASETYLLPQLANEDIPSGTKAIAQSTPNADSYIPQYSKGKFAAAAPLYFRNQRLNELANARSYHSLNSLIEIQNDVIDASARAILPLIARELWYQPGPETERSAMLESLGNWTGSFDSLKSEPLIYKAWEEATAELIFSDELVQNFDLIAPLQSALLAEVYANPQWEGWCDIRPTPAIESCSTIAEKAFDIAIARLKAEIGENPNSWRWGQEHNVNMQHLSISHDAFLSNFTNITLESGGSEQTLLRFGKNNPAPLSFHSDYGPNLRMIIDFNDLSHSKFILNAGQSGHFLSRHYEDQTAAWSIGEYVDIFVDDDVIRSNMNGELTFIRP